MKRYRLIYRGIRNTCYSLDTHTEKRESRGIGNEAEAQRLVDARNEAAGHTWRHVMDAMVVEVERGGNALDRTGIHDGIRAVHFASRKDSTIATCMLPAP